MNLDERLLVLFLGSHVESRHRIAYLSFRERHLSCISTSFEEFSSLEYLDVSSNVLSSVESSDLSNREFESVSALRAPQLWGLDLSYMNLRDVDCIRFYAVFGRLDVRGNRLTLSSLFPLRNRIVVELDIRENEEIEQYPEYRLLIAYLLPNLLVLNGKFITHEERTRAAQIAESTLLAAGIDQRNLGGRVDTAMKSSSSSRSSIGQKTSLTECLEIGSGFVRALGAADAEREGLIVTPFASFVYEELGSSVVESPLLDRFRLNFLILYFERLRRVIGPFSDQPWMPSYNKNKRGNIIQPFVKSLSTRQADSCAILMFLSIHFSLPSSLLQHALQFCLSSPSSFVTHRRSQSADVYPLSPGELFSLPEFIRMGVLVLLDEHAVKQGFSLALTQVFGRDHEDFVKMTWIAHTSFRLFSEANLWNDQFIESYPELFSYLHSTDNSMGAYLSALEVSAHAPSRRRASQGSVVANSVESPSRKASRQSLRSSQSSSSSRSCFPSNKVDLGQSVVSSCEDVFGSLGVHLNRGLPQIGDAVMVRAKSVFAVGEIISVPSDGIVTISLPHISQQYNVFRKELLWNPRGIWMLMLETGNSNMDNRSQLPSSLCTLEGFVDNFAWKNKFLLSSREGSQRVHGRWDPLMTTPFSYTRDADLSTFQTVEVVQDVAIEDLRAAGIDVPESVFAPPERVSVEEENVSSSMFLTELESENSSISNSLLSNKDEVSKDLSSNIPLTLQVPVRVRSRLSAHPPLKRPMAWRDVPGKPEFVVSNPVFPEHSFNTFARTSPRRVGRCMQSSLSVSSNIRSLTSLSVSPEKEIGRHASSTLLQPMCSRTGTPGHSVVFSRSTSQSSGSSLSKASESGLARGKGEKSSRKLPDETLPVLDRLPLRPPARRSSTPVANVLMKDLSPSGMVYKRNHTASTVSKRIGDLSPSGKALSPLSRDNIRSASSLSSSIGSFPSQDESISVGRTVSEEILLRSSEAVFGGSLD